MTYYKILSKLLSNQNFKITQLKFHRPASQVAFYKKLFLKDNQNSLCLILKNESRHYSSLTSLNSSCWSIERKLTETFSKQLWPTTICLKNPIQMSSILSSNFSCTSFAKTQGFKTSAKSTESLPSVCEVLELCKEKLSKEEIDESELQAEYIVAQALGVKRIQLHTMMSESISAEKIETIEKMMDCRLARMPLQYILGDWDFHSLSLKLRPPVFIPRPETEGLVNIAVVLLRDVHEPVVLDVGCGSGAISLSLLNHFHELKCVAVDQSKYAIELTAENAKDLNLRDRLQLVQGKVTDESLPPLPVQKFDCIVSNPPYVLRKDLIDLQPEITLYEDLRALDGGKEGLDVIARILLHGQHLIKDDGFILMEVDPCHRYLLPSWMERNKTSLKICQFYKDHYGVHRYVKFVKKLK